MGLLILMGDSSGTADSGDVLLVDADGTQLTDADGALLEEPA
jgi:hypothetical protein